ncbi:hypothetical protein [Flavobacterium litorale]|uniref:Uncharacterized protein n=1 Tax=Flavobacterium litorale TaxID=2856519 RepID=A0ABX8VDK7_9FLAO|nr:hypothetical protein [Flavobacterium litorale]QYJ68920.1 hypothetical protein K1I41_03280 [Flavobacterium litorale]
MKNITVKRYTQLGNTALYDAVLEHLNPNNSFAGKQMNVNSMPYANVKYAIRLLPKINNWDGVYQLFEICYEVTEKQFWKARITDYFSARKFILNSLAQVVQNENRALSSQSTDNHLWKMAGAEKLAPYNDTLPLVQLGKLLGQYPFDLGRKPYGEIFSLLAQTKLQNEVEADYQKLSRP